MNLTGTIESAERQFRQILEEFFISVYDEKSLPSHGIEHHRRVWNNAKEILLLCYSKKENTQADFITRLIIACYLHDIGMSVDPGFRHGIHSRDLTVKFLTANNLKLIEFSDLLDTVENHDKKDYNGIREVTDLLTILSVADDLEAFGYTGIYRYSEIYLTRNIEPLVLGEKIIENAEKRFKHFKETFGEYTELFQKHHDRYKILTGFFNEYNRQAVSYEFNCISPKGYCGVIELFIKMNKEKTGITDIIKEQNRFKNDEVIFWFFNGLKSEV
jgi:hypothetical protein